jgi:polyphosphate kinase
MPRNLFERCEVVFPVNDAQLRARLKDEILAAYLADTAKTRMLEPNGDYRRARPANGKTAFSAQDFFMQLAEGRVTADQIPPPVEMRDAVATAKPVRLKSLAASKSQARKDKKTSRAIPRLQAEDVSAASPS